MKGEPEEFWPEPGWAKMCMRALLDGDGDLAKKESQQGACGRVPTLGMRMNERISPWDPPGNETELKGPDFLKLDRFLLLFSGLFPFALL